MPFRYTDEPDASPPMREKGGRERGQLPLYKVILHHCTMHELMFVVRAVMELTRFCRAEATHKMWEAHHRGQSVLLVTWLERAELYVEQFATKEIPVSIEPV